MWSCVNVNTKLENMLDELGYIHNHLKITIIPNYYMYQQQHQHQHK